MPPKPWETRKKPTQNISQIIQSNPTLKEDVPKITSDIPPEQMKKTTQNTTLTANPSSMYGASSTGYGGYGGYSGYGGYGGGYGGYGGLGGYSSYGGYGGYGSSMYGMGGYGRMGMGMGQEDQNGFLFRTVMALDTFGFLVNMLCDIGRSIDQSSEGLSMFYASFKNIIKKLEKGVTGGLKYVLEKIKNFFRSLFNFLLGNIFFLNQKNLKTKYKVIKVILGMGVILLLVSFYPLIKNNLKQL